MRSLRFLSGTAINIGLLGRSCAGAAFLPSPAGIKTKPFATATRTSLASSSSYLDSLGTAASYSTSASVASTINTNNANANANTNSNANANGNFDYVPVLSLEQADSIANQVIAVCQRNPFNPVSVFVLDAAGNTIVSKRMDGCSPVGIPDFAKAKAYSCVVNRYPSRAFRDRYTAEEASAKFCQMTSMVAISQGQMAPFPGGILLFTAPSPSNTNSHFIGAVGVSGAAGDEDEYCAIQGVIESNLGLNTVPEKHSCSTVKD